MNIYLASGASNRILIEAVRLLIENTFPFKIISSWHRTPPIENVTERAIIDFREIDIADTVIAFYPYGLNGTICELAYSFCKNKHTLYVRPEDSQSEDPLIIGLFDPKFVFHNMNDLMNYLQGISK